LINRSNLRKKEKKNTNTSSNNNTNNSLSSTKSFSKWNQKDSYPYTILEVIYTEIKRMNNGNNNENSQYFPNPVRLLIIDNNSDNYLYKQILATNLSKWKGVLYTTDKLFSDINFSHILILDKTIKLHFLKMILNNNPKVVNDFWVQTYANTGLISSSGIIPFCNYKWKLYLDNICVNQKTFDECFHYDFFIPINIKEEADFVIVN
jgi:hypothetical protein